jgi:hypothetical protein
MAEPADCGSLRAIECGKIDNRLEGWRTGIIVVLACNLGRLAVII